MGFAAASWQGHGEATWPPLSLCFQFPVAESAGETGRQLKDFFPHVFLYIRFYIIPGNSFAHL